MEETEGTLAYPPPGPVEARFDVKEAAEPLSIDPDGKLPDENE